MKIFFKKGNEKLEPKLDIMMADVKKVLNISDHAGFRDLIELKRKNVNKF